MHFVCEFCDAFFESAGDYERHRQSAHQRRAPRVHG